MNRITVTRKLTAWASAIVAAAQRVVGAAAEAHFAAMDAQVEEACANADATQDESEALERSAKALLLLADEKAVEADRQYRYAVVLHDAAEEETRRIKDKINAKGGAL